VTSGRLLYTLKAPVVGKRDRPNLERTAFQLRHTLRCLRRLIAADHAARSDDASVLRLPRRDRLRRATATLTSGGVIPLPFAPDIDLAQFGPRGAVLAVWHRSPFVVGQSISATACV